MSNMRSVIEVLRDHRIKYPHEVLLGASAYCSRCGTMTYWIIEYDDGNVLEPKYARCVECGNRVRLSSSSIYN